MTRASFASDLLERLFPDHRSDGWRVVAACFACGALSAPGQSYALGLYFESFVTDLGLSRVSIASAYGWATLSAAALLPLLGRLADRTSSRAFLGVVVASIGVALLGLASAGSLLGLGVGLFCLRLLGQGAIGLGTITAVLRWFDRHRGRAAAIAALGYAFGELTMPAVITTLSEQLGWRGSMVALGGLYVALAILVASVLRDPPRSVPGSAEVARALPAASSWLRRPIFWTLVALATISPTVLTGVALHQLALFRSVGWSTESVVAALRAYAVANLLATYGTGLLLDRVPSKVGLSLSMALLGLAVAVPLFGPSMQAGPFVFWGLLGAAAGSTTGTHGVLWAEHFGVESIGAIKGVVSAARNAATAVGAVAFAALAGLEGDYAQPLLVSGSLAGVGLAAALLLPRPDGRRGGEGVPPPHRPEVQAATASSAEA